MTAAERDVVVTDNPPNKRFEIRVGGELAGFSRYRVRGDAYLFTHTEVDAKFAGMGLASRLVRDELDEMRRRGLYVLPFCPFVRAFIAKHADYLDLVRPADRSRFELDGA